MLYLNRFRSVEVVQRYASFLRWFMPDALGQRKLLVMFVILASAVGVGFQAMTFGAIIYYANLIATGQHLTADLYLIEIDLDPRVSVQLLIATSISALSFLALSALSVYFARIGNIKMGRNYNEHCIERLLNLVGKDKQPVLKTVEGKYIDDKYLMRMMIGDARLCGRVLRIMLDMIVPITTLLVAFSVLIYLNAKLTLIVLVCMSAFILFQAHVSRSGARDTKKFEGYTPIVLKILKGLLSQNSTQIEHLPKNKSHKPKSYRSVSDQSGALRRQFNAFEGRIRATEQSRLVSALFTAIMVGLLLFILGSKIITSGIGWSELVVYLVALRFAMTSLQLVFGQLTTMNRFYPQLQRYISFVRSYPTKIQNSKSARLLPIILDVKDSASMGGSHRLILNRGNLVAISSIHEVNKYTYSHLVSHISKAADLSVEEVLSDTIFLSSKHSLVGYAASQIFSPNNKDEIPQINSDSKWLKDFRSIVPSFDSCINNTQWEKMSSDLRNILLLKSLENCHEELVLIESSMLQGLEEEDWILIRRNLNGKLLFVSYESQGTDCIEELDFDHVVIAEEDKVFAMGDLSWYKKEKSRIQLHMRRISTKYTPNAVGALGVEEDFEMG